jgi:hypothetical protein
MEALIASGEWVATGQTRSRRLRPSDSFHSGQSLGDGWIESNHAGPEDDPE